jgi:hypothetical protein
VHGNCDGIVDFSAVEKPIRAPTRQLKITGSAPE